MTLEDRGRFLLDYIDLLLHERVDETRALTHDRWVINKMRALASWYTKGLDNGSHLRTAINSADSLPSLRDTIGGVFLRRASRPHSEPCIFPDSRVLLLTRRPAVCRIEPSSRHADVTESASVRHIPSVSSLNALELQPQFW